MLALKRRFHRSLSAPNTHLHVEALLTTQVLHLVCAEEDAVEAVVTECRSWWVEVAMPNTAAQEMDGGEWGLFLYGSAVSHER